VSLLGRIVGWLRRHHRKLERLSGGVLIGLGVKLALDS
jgi:threonine/homoserine/homoserine lactone efflux protein